MITASNPVNSPFPYKTRLENSLGYTKVLVSM